MIKTQPTRRNRSLLSWDDVRRPILYFVAALRTSSDGMHVLFMTADIDEAFEHADQWLNDPLDDFHSNFDFDALAIVEQRGDVTLRRWHFDCLDGTTWVSRSLEHESHVYQKSRPDDIVYHHQPLTVDARWEHLVEAAEAILNQAVRERR